MNDLSTAQLRRLLAINIQLERLQKEKAKLLAEPVLTKKRGKKLSAATKGKLSASLKAVWAARRAKTAAVPKA